MYGIIITTALFIAWILLVRHLMNKAAVIADEPIEPFVPPIADEIKLTYCFYKMEEEGLTETKVRADSISEAYKTYLQATSIVGQMKYAAVN